MTPKTSSPEATSHSSTTQVHAATAIHANATVVMPPPNLAQAPAVPVGAPVLQKGESKTLKHMTHEQVALLSSLGVDFQSSKTWTADFGSHAPSQATMVAMVQGTASIFTESSNSKNWSTYVQALRVLCGDSLVGQLESLGTMFEAAVAQNPGLAQTYPSLALYLGARSAATAKANATKKAKKAAQSSTSTTAAPTATPAAPTTPVTGTHS